MKLIKSSKTIMASQLDSISDPSERFVMEITSYVLREASKAKKSGLFKLTDACSIIITICTNIMINSIGQSLFETLLHREDRVQLIKTISIELADAIQEYWDVIEEQHKQKGSLN